MGRPPEDSIIKKYGSIENYKSYLHEKMSGKHFYTNGVDDRKFADGEDIPEGWYRGRTNSGKGTKGYVFINNGVEQTQIKPDASIPIGWVRGALPFSEEHKRKISKALLEYERTHEHAKALSEAHSTKEFKERVRNTVLERYGVENVFQNEEIKEKIKKNNLEKYGVEYTTQRVDVKEKVKQTCLEHYGVPAPMMSLEVQEKSKQTCLEHYGVEFAFQSKELRDKYKKTCLERYGVEYPSQSEVVKEKSRQTNLVRYGNPIPMRLDEMKDKVKRTNIEKYGVPHHLQDSNIMNKQIETNLNKRGVKYNIQLPQCKESSNNSKPNRDFAKMLDNAGIQYEREFPISGFSYDFKVGNTLIEIDPSATHNTLWNPFGDRSGINKDYHYNKSHVAEENGYHCIHIFDWDDPEKIVKCLLIDKQRIYARKCDVREVSLNSTNDFLEINHLQGSCRGQDIRLGLYYNNELVSLMTFGKPRYNKNYEWELLRYCSSHKVVGGAERIFKHFVSTYGRSIISYCDCSKFRGKVYRDLGFSLYANNRPSLHWYCLKSNKHFTDNFIRQYGFDNIFGTSFGKGTSNNDLMINSGFLSVYDCGQDTYVVSEDNMSEQRH